MRKNIDGDLFLEVYGKAVAANIDPIEKKPLYHFLPGQEIFSFGTIGCNFRCSFCQNWDISQVIADTKSHYEDSRTAEPAVEELCGMGEDLEPQEIIDYCVKNGIVAIGYTYNEPTIFSEYAHDTGVLAREIGLKNVYVSNGYESRECLQYMRQFCDAINIDIKSLSPDFYAKICGGVNIKGVLGTVVIAREMGFWVECTTLVIPGVNDSDEELDGIAHFIAVVSKDIPWHVTAFHPAYKMTDRGETPSDTLMRAWKIGKKEGLKYVYVGNVPSLENPDIEINYGNTFCPKCGKVLVERGYMECKKCIVKVDKNGKGKCPFCRTKIAGLWKWVQT